MGAFGQTVRRYEVGEVLNLPGPTAVARAWRIVEIEPDPDPEFQGRLYLELVDSD
jgi:hypothetical protein